MSNPVTGETKLSVRSGSALVIVLWSVALMAVLIGGFAFDSHVEGRITYYYRNRTRADYLAKSGIEVARMLMIKQKVVSEMGEDEEPDEDDRWYTAAKRLGEHRRVLVTEKLGDGEIVLSITSEIGRLNVNRMGEELWEATLEHANVPEDFWPEIIESLQDWIDTDEDPRTDGAETEDFYSTLEPPYVAKNGPLDTVGELLLVKGFSRAILFGGPLEDIEDEEGEPLMVRGIEGLLTTYGSGKVNINSAGSNVLMVVAGGDPLVVGAIIEERDGLLLPEGSEEDTSFKNWGELTSRVLDVPEEMKDLITYSSSIYRITSIGRVGGVERRIRCTAERDGEALRFLRWQEE